MENPDDTEVTQNDTEVTQREEGSRAKKDQLRKASGVNRRREQSAGTTQGTGDTGKARTFLKGETPSPRPQGGEWAGVRSHRPAQSEASCLPLCPNKDLTPLR